MESMQKLQQQVQSKLLEEFIVKVSTLINVDISSNKWQVKNAQKIIKESKKEAENYYWKPKIGEDELNIQMNKEGIIIGMELKFKDRGRVFVNLYRGTGAFIQLNNSDSRVEVKLSKLTEKIFYSQFTNKMQTTLMDKNKQQERLKELLKQHGYTFADENKEDEKEEDKTMNKNETGTKTKKKKKKKNKQKKTRDRQSK